MIFENDYDPEGVVDVDTWISADGAVWESAGTPAFAAADILRLDVFSGGSGLLAVIDHEDGPCELWSSSDGIDWVLESDYPTPDNPYPGDLPCGTPTDLGLVKGSEMSVDGGRTWFDIPPSPHHPSACQGGGYNSAFPSDAIVHFGGNGGCAEIWVGTFES